MFTSCKTCKTRTTVFNGHLVCFYFCLSMQTTASCDAYLHICCAFVGQTITWCAVGLQRQTQPFRFFSDLQMDPCQLACDALAPERNTL